MTVTARFFAVLRERMGQGATQVQLAPGETVAALWETLVVERRWQSGDRVELDLPMPVERMYAHPLVRQDAGCVALQRGPLVYCLEETDNPVALHTMRLPKEAPLGVHFEHDLLGGVAAITGTALVADGTEWGRTLYRPESAPLIPRPLTAIPYYAWDNRQPGQMRVWIQEAADATM